VSKELIFLVEESLEGGYEARALGYSIFTEGETIEDVRTAVRNAVACILIMLFYTHLQINLPQTKNLPLPTSKGHVSGSLSRILINEQKKFMGLINRHVFLPLQYNPLYSDSLLYSLNVKKGNPL